MAPSRIQLVQVSDIETCYKNKSGQYLQSSVLGECSFVTPTMDVAIHSLRIGVNKEGGTFRISDLSRTWAMQEKARKEKPNLANPPGRSYHQANSAVDISVNGLDFPIPRSKWIKKLWDIALPLGFHAVISQPLMDVNENWHFQIYGKDWEEASKNVSSSELAKAMILDCGRWDPKENELVVKKMFVQAQLIRLGLYEVGKIDGIIGTNTKKCLAKLGYIDSVDDIDAVVEFVKNK